MLVCMTTERFAGECFHWNASFAGYNQSHCSTKCRGERIKVGSNSFPSHLSIPFINRSEQLLTLGLRRKTGCCSNPSGFPPKTWGSIPMWPAKKMQTWSVRAKSMHQLKFTQVIKCSAIALVFVRGWWCSLRRATSPTRCSWDGSDEKTPRHCKADAVVLTWWSVWWLCE